MNNPLGSNPIGEHAPGLPRHDKPLPGHVAGQSSPMGLGGGAAPTPGSPFGLNQSYNGPALPDWITKPIGRAFFFLWVYLAAPVLAAVYPIAGIAGLAGAGMGYLLAKMLGGGYDMTHGWAWTGCFLGVVALMRFETNFESANPGYRRLRGRLRVALGFIGMFWFEMSDHGNSFGVALITSAIFAVMLHFVLRSKWLRFIWHVMQHTGWMRASVEPPPLQQFQGQQSP